MFSSLICFYLFFLYISFGLSLGKALRRLVNVGWNSVTKIWSQISYSNTALPLAPDLQKPTSIPREETYPLDQKTSNYALRVKQQKICLLLEAEVLGGRSRFSREEIHDACKFLYAGTCIKEHASSRSGLLLFFADCFFDWQNERVDQRYTETTQLSEDWATALILDWFYNKLQRS